MSTVSLAGLLLLAASTPQSIPRVDGKEQKMRLLVATYADCIVRRHHNQASAIIMSLADNSDIVKKGPQLFDDQCFLKVFKGEEVSFHFPDETLQYAIADALVQMDFRISGPSTFEGTLPLAHTPLVTPQEEAATAEKARSAKEKEEIHKRIERRNAYNWMSRYAECVVRRSPLESRFLLLTPPDTSEETSRFKALQEFLSACLTPGTFHFTRYTLRGAIALNYYRLAGATKVKGDSDKTPPA